MVGLAVQFPPGPIIKEQVLDMCYNLVVFDPKTKTFRFIHYTVREYPVKHPRFSSHAKSHAMLVEACLFLLVMSGKTEGSNSFLDELAPIRRISIERGVAGVQWYASLYWPYHVQKSNCERLVGNLRRLIDFFLFEEMGPHSPFHEWPQKYYRTLSKQIPLDILTPLRASVAPEEPSAAFVACSFNLLDVVQRLIEEQKIEPRAMNRDRKFLKHVILKHCNETS